MIAPSIRPTGHEIQFGEDELIVSKTDTRGIITYANDTFCRVSGYQEHELIGRAHNIIRHPHMPACIFKLLWDTLQNGREIFAYVVNLTRHGDHYWVLAHVTPSCAPDGRITGFHSNRRLPHRDAVEKVKKLYTTLRKEEMQHPNRRAGMIAAEQTFTRMISEAGMNYGQFVFSLSNETRLDIVAT